MSIIMLLIMLMLPLLLLIMIIMISTMLILIVLMVLCWCWCCVAGGGGVAGRPALQGVPGPGVARQCGGAGGGESAPGHPPGPAVRAAVLGPAGYLLRQHHAV